MRRIWVTVFMVHFLRVGPNPMAWASSERPNIVFIVADDLGFNDVGFHGSDVKTPNIDALAGHGIILNRHYALPCCTPSRAALMTAKYPIRNGMQGFPLAAGVPGGLPLEEKIFPQYFNELGYKSHLVGKWHLGYTTWAQMPTNRGFDSFYGYLNGFLSYYDGVHTQNGISGRDFRRDEFPAWVEVYGKYLTDVLTKEAVSVINNHRERGGLLLVLNHAAPHTGNLNMAREGPPNTDNSSGRAFLTETVRMLDDSVGVVVSALNTKGVLNNSIIVFLSDNGAPTVDEKWGYNNFGSNWPFRGVKLSSHEGGVRTAALIWSPMLQARISTDLFHITDWLPTLYTAAGGRSSNLNDLDGVNQWDSLITGTSSPRREVLLNMEEKDGYNDALIQGKWKLIKHHPPGAVQAFANKYYGVCGRSHPYDSAEVDISVVGRILGRPPLSYVEVREKASINKTCQDLTSAEAIDCYTEYCLFDILADSSECRDLSSHFPVVVDDLKSKLAFFRRQMIHKLNSTFDARATPAFWEDYWSPWLGCYGTNSNSRATSASALFLPLVFLLMFER